MSAAKHTPGPWVIRHDAYVCPAAHDDRPIGAAADPVLHASKYAAIICRLSTSPHNKNEANDALIVAAPDMLEALQRIAKFDEYEPAGPAVRTAVAAIAKATGSAA
jgi:hypothetical protein